MSSVTYKSQPAIQKTRGAVPLAGTSHIYTVSKLLWPDAVEEFIEGLLIGRSLHLCCGKSKIGTVRLDLYEKDIDVRADVTRLPFPDHSFNTVIIDPPYNGSFQFNHDYLSEIFRASSYRVIHQHWYIPVDKLGRSKKDHSFLLTELYNWMPNSYFGRVQTIAVFDRIGEKD